MNAKLYNFIDIFGINIGLRYLNEEQYRTKFGALATMIITGFIIAQIILVGSELFRKEKPDVIFSERYVKQPERFDLKPTTYNFAFGAQFPSNYTHFIDPSVYTVQVQQLSMKKVFNEETQNYDQVWNTIDVALHPCTPQDFQVESSKDYFNELSGVENMYCLDLANNDLFIEGNFDQDSYGTLNIIFRLCDDKTSPVKCKDNVSEILTNSYVALYFNDLIVNPKSYYPFSVIGRDAFWNASPQYPKDATVYYRNIYVESDRGILFEDQVIDRSTAVSYIDQQTIFGENSYYFQIYLRFEKTKETLYHRKYKKVDQLLAEIGGIAKALMIIGFILFQPINKLNLHQALANSLFSFRKVQQEEAKQQKNQEIGKFADLIEGHKKINSQRFPPNTGTDRYILAKENSIQPEFSNNNNNFLTNQSPRKPQLKNANNKLQNNNKNIFVSSSPENKERSQETKLSSPQFVFKNSSSSQQPNVLNSNRVINNNEISSNCNNNNNPKSTLKLLDIIKQRNRLAESVKVISSQNNINTQGIHSRNLDDFSNPLDTQKIKSRHNTHNNGDQTNGNMKNVFKQQQKENQSLQLTWSDYIKYYLWPFGSFKQKQQQIDYSIETIYQHLDMIYIVKKLLELEKLKQLLLNEDQIKLIQFFPKPYIDVNQIQTERQTHKKKKSTEINILNNPNESTEKEKAVEAFKALQNMISKPELSDIDKKILEMLDGSILKFIENNEDYLKEWEESIEIENHQANAIDVNQLNINIPLNSDENNSKQQQQDNQVLEFFDSNQIEVKRLNKQSSPHQGLQSNQTAQQKPHILHSKQNSRLSQKNGNINANQLKYQLELENLQQIESKKDSHTQLNTFLETPKINSTEKISHFIFQTKNDNEMIVQNNSKQNQENPNDQNNEQELIKFEDNNFHTGSSNQL